MNAAQDVDILKQMAADLKDYLLAEPVFWQMQGSSSYPKLSLGMLLLTQARLEAVDSQLSQTQRAERDAAARQIDATLGSWQVAAEKKAERELHTRVNLWQQYWDDCNNDPHACGEQYKHDVTQRVIAGMLVRRFPRLADTNDGRALDQLDRLASGRTVKQGFVWEAELQSGFPEAEYSYLYGSPASR